MEIFFSLCFSFSYGYSNLRNISSLISGVGIFFFGTGLSLYHGFQGFLDPQPLTSLNWVPLTYFYSYSYPFSVPVTSSLTFFLYLLLTPSLLSVSLTDSYLLSVSLTDSYSYLLSVSLTDSYLLSVSLTDSYSYLLSVPLTDLLLPSFCTSY